MMFDPVIVCDKCEYAGCTVSEITPAPRMSMTEFAASKKDQRNQIAHDEVARTRRPRDFRIQCPKCGHSSRFTMDPPDYAIKADKASKDA